MASRLSNVQSKSNDARHDDVCRIYTDDCRKIRDIEYSARAQNGNGAYITFKNAECHGKKWFNRAKEL